MSGEEAQWRRAWAAECRKAMEHLAAAQVSMDTIGGPAGAWMDEDPSQPSPMALARDAADSVTSTMFIMRELWDRVLGDDYPEEVTQPGVPVPKTEG